MPQQRLPPRLRRTTQSGIWIIGSRTVRSLATGNESNGIPDGATAELSDTNQPGDVSPGSLRRQAGPRVNKGEAF